jgi:hypothetical protein
MTTAQPPEQSGAPLPAQPSLATKKKRNRRIVVVVVAIVVVVVVAFGVYYLTSFHFSIWNEHQVVTVHNPQGNVNSTALYAWQDAGYFQIGRQIKFDVPYNTTNPSPSVTVLTRIVCNTPGFTFVGSSPSLPIVLSNDPNVNITATLTFDSPSSAYNGPFDYTEHFDYYPATLAGKGLIACGWQNRPAHDGAHRLRADQVLQAL